MSSFLPGWFAGLIAAKTPASLTFIGFTEDATDLTTYSFASAAIGVADATRRVVVVVHWGESASTRSLSSATIGGVAATIHAQTSGVTRGVAIISALVPTGTTATIALTFSGAMQRAAIGVYRAINETSASPTATATDTTFTGAVLDVNVNVPVNGWVVAGTTDNGVAGRTHAWVGVTKQYDTTSGEAAGIIYSGGHDTGLAAATPRTVNTTVSNATGISGAAVAMSWG